MAKNIVKISTLDQEELRPYRTLRRPLDHLKEGIFVGEGEKVVRRLLNSHLTVISLLVTPDWFARLESDLSSRNEELTIFIAEKSLVETIVGCNLHQGVMAIAQVPADRSLDDIVQSVNGQALMIALEGLVNAENVGVIVRNCAGFGVDAIIVGENSSSPYLRRAVRNSMGTVFQVPIVHVENLASSLMKLRSVYNYNVIAAHPAGTNTIFDSELKGNSCIVVGNEGDGLSKSILDVCSTLVSIPMKNDVDSLNVANASAVLLYEACRQRHSRV
jgi:tRNA G18 (ribose-2'-O)-methylase SpoU